MGIDIAQFWGSVIMFFVRQLFDWLMVRDYEAAKHQAAKRTAARYSRGNVSVQNGWFMDSAGLKQLSAAGDLATRRIKQRASHI